MSKKEVTTLRTYILDNTYLIECVSLPTEKMIVESIRATNDKPFRIWKDMLTLGIMVRSRNAPQDRLISGIRWNLYKQGGYSTSNAASSSRRVEALVIRQAVGKALKTLDIIEAFVYVPDPKKGQSLYQNAIIMKSQIGELRKQLNSLAV